MDPKTAAAGEAADPKADQYIYRTSDLSPEEAAKAPGGMDFIADKNKIDETYHLPVNAARKSTWCVCFDLTPRESSRIASALCVLS